MIVLILRNIRPGFRGYLTRWLVQPQSGVFLGHTSARIHECLWKKVCEEIDLRGGSAILITPSDNEQGYILQSYGDPPKIVRDFDGLMLPKTPVVRS